jgi:hypothetical protein
MNAIQEMTLEERKVALAHDYIDALERGKRSRVVAPTHAECNDVTEGIRQGLKERELIKGGVQWDTLRDLKWTEAEKNDYAHYKSGLVVQFNRHVKGFALGEQVEVVDISDEAVRVRTDEKGNSRIKMLPLEEAEKFNVYERDALEICEGERIRITMNSRTEDRHRVSNGNLYQVDYIDHQGRLVLENGWKLDRDFKHFEYGYASTSHSVQAKTVDCVFVAQTAKLSTHASDLAQFYVSTSRGRSELKIYTDDIELLKENVSRIRERQMATELFRGGQESEAETIEMESSAELGKMETLKREMAIELERLLHEKQEREIRRAQEMAMAMVV